jgi:hypothetical protein
MTLRSTEPEASTWWEGRDPRFLVDLQINVKNCIPLVFRKPDIPVNLSETANTDGLAHVDVTGNGGGADVEPVDVLGRKLLGV